MVLPLLKVYMDSHFTIYILKAFTKRLGIGNHNEDVAVFCCSLAWRKLVYVNKINSVSAIQGDITILLDIKQNENLHLKIDMFCTV